MSQIIDLKSRLRGEEDKCTRTLLMNSPYVIEESGTMHICKEEDMHRGPHQCYCGVVFRDDCTIYIPEPLPGFPTAPAWVHVP